MRGAAPTKKSAAYHPVRESVRSLVDAYHSFMSKTRSGRERCKGHSVRRMITRAGQPLLDDVDVRELRLRADFRVPRFARDQ